MDRMAETFGISHIAMKVSDLDRAVRFYEQAFGARQYARGEHFAQVLGPGPTDVIAFELMPEGAATPGGLIHFGLRLVHPSALDALLERVLAAGGTIKEHGDFGDNQPFAFVLDPEGYEIEIWYENTPHHRQNESR
jgi:catechol 2,3-dioxygenase-like lactoylglutathione lyase family enzyme